MIDNTNQATRYTVCVPLRNSDTREAVVTELLAVISEARVRWFKLSDRQYSENIRMIKLVFVTPCIINTKVSPIINDLFYI